jgi:hypothetical protein
MHDNSMIKSSKISPSFFKLRVTNDSNDFNDELVVYYNPTATRNYDSGIEARKIFSIMKESSQIYTRTDDETNLAINALPEEDYANIPMDFKCGIQANYTIEVVESHAIDIINITDLVTGESENLLINKYKFSGSPEDLLSRFIINSQQKGTTENILIPEVKTEKVLLFPTRDGFDLQNLNSQPIHGYLSVTNMLGQTVYKENITLITEESRSGFEPGFYIVSFSANNYIAVKKMLIR